LTKAEVEQKLLDEYYALLDESGVADFESVIFYAKAYETMKNSLPPNSNLLFGTDVGTADGYLLNISGVSIYNEGDTYIFKVSNTNTGASTINVNSTGSKNIKRNNGDDLSAGDIQENQIVIVTYNGAYFQLHSAYNVTNIAALLNNKGDMIVASADNTPEILPVGSIDGQCVIVDSATATGLNYGSPYPSGGTNGQVVMKDDSLPSGVKWSNVGGGGGSGLRNTVLSGAIDAAGAPNYITAGTGLACNLSATATNLIITFANGFETTNGNKDKISGVIADVTSAWSSLTANSRCYLYADRNSDSGAITYGFTTVIPEYRDAKNASPSNGMHNYIIPEGKMYVYTTSWAEVQRVFVGEVVTGASSVTTVIIYPFCKDWVGDDLYDRYVSISDSATIEINLALANTFLITLAGTGRTVNIRNPRNNGKYNLIFIQDATGSRTVTTWNFYDANNNSTSTNLWADRSVAPALTTTANKRDIITTFYVAGKYYTDINPNF
jgi:hypothetical protein